MSSTVTRYSVFGDQALDSMLSAIFRIVEDNYIRRTTYESDISTLSNRISMLEALNAISFSIDESTGNLMLSVPDNGDEVNISIDSSGNLILVSNDTETDDILERYSFNINSNGYLILSFT